MSRFGSPEHLDFLEDKPIVFRRKKHEKKPADHRALPYLLYSLYFTATSAIMIKIPIDDIPMMHKLMTIPSVITFFYMPIAAICYFASKKQNNWAANIMAINSIIFIIATLNFVTKIIVPTM